MNSRILKKFKNSGIAFSGGAALGMAHIGIIKALQEYEIHPAYISGASAGAMIGGLYAYGITPDEMRKIASSFGNSKLLQYIRPTLKPGGLIKTQQIRKFFFDIMGNVKIEDLEKPFIASTVDLISGNLYYINKGSLVDAIVASISIPGVFQPFIFEDKVLIDGGVRGRIPLHPLEQYKPSAIIASNLIRLPGFDSKPGYLDIGDSSMTKRTMPRQWPGTSRRLSKITQRATNLMLSEMNNLQISVVKPDLVFDIEPVITPFDFKGSDKAIDAGYKMAMEKLENLFTR